MRITKSMTCFVIAAASMDIAESRLRRLRKVHQVGDENSSNQAGDGKESKFLLSSFDRLLVDANIDKKKEDFELDEVLARELQTMSMGNRRLSGEIDEFFDRELQTMSMDSRRLNSETDHVFGRQLQSMSM